MNDITCWPSSDWTSIRPTLSDVIRQRPRSGLSRPEISRRSSTTSRPSKASSGRTSSPARRYTRTSCSSYQGCAIPPDEPEAPGALRPGVRGLPASGCAGRRVATVHTLFPKTVQTGLKVLDYRHCQIPHYVVLVPIDGHSRPAERPSSRVGLRYRPRERQDVLIAEPPPDGFDRPLLSRTNDHFGSARRTPYRASALPAFLPYRVLLVALRPPVAAAQLCIPWPYKVITAEEGLRGQVKWRSPANLDRARTRAGFPYIFRGFVELRCNVETPAMCGTRRIVGAVSDLDFQGEHLPRREDPSVRWSAYGRPIPGRGSLRNRGPT